MAFRPRDALLALPVLGVLALALCVATGMHAGFSYALAAVSGGSLAGYAAIELRDRQRQTCPRTTAREPSPRPGATSE